MPLFKKRRKEEDLGKPTPGATEQAVPFGDLAAEGIHYVPEDLADGNADVTETANTGANKEETWVKITNGANKARFFRKGESKLVVLLQTAVPAQITSGELVFKMQDANQSRTKTIHRMDLAGFAPLADQRSQLFKKPFPFNLALPPNYTLLLDVKSASTLATAQSQFSIENSLVAHNVTLEEWKRHYGKWLTI